MPHFWTPTLATHTHEKNMLYDNTEICFIPRHFRNYIWAAADTANITKKSMYDTINISTG